jgi:phosphoribosylformylglycinamidine cyclo-ligase
MTWGRIDVPGEVLKRTTTYAQAGVDQDVMNEAAKRLVGALSFRREGLGAPVTLEGGYSGLIEFGDVLLSMCTDGVGTKLMIAEEMGRWDTVGIDCVAMNVNDLICIGAEPLAFVDYIATPEPDPEVWAALGRGLDEGCRQANISLVGGETSVMPEVVRSLDLTGTALGWVGKDSVITGRDVGPGDVLVGLASTGLHSNGYTLVRKLVEERDMGWDAPFGGGSLGEEALRPTAIYVRAALDLIKEVAVHGMANITGGGLRNLGRWRPDVRAVVDDPLPAPPIFAALQEWGGVDETEMWQTFNMGMGFVAAVPEDQADAALDAVQRYHDAKVVGRIEEGSGIHHEPLGLDYSGY